ncbi:unnamed protein product [Somion occarium]|uniref:RNase III domain-containing protein n=1 Tax=Somion occarium TaxID=3059160 RepID=A0ABP1DP81_9APHY
MPADISRKPCSSPTGGAVNHVHDYLSKTRTSMLLRDVPNLPTNLLARARGARTNSDENNDLLEFIGDRALNLAVAILVEKNKINRAHHSTVRRVVCSNDTIGRLAFCLRFHVQANTDAQDRFSIDEWHPLSNDHPPKVLADLFEAYVGAVFVQHGWSILERWLNKLFTPIVKAATGDFWLSVSPEQLFGISSKTPKIKVMAPETKSQGKLLAYIEFKRDVLTAQGKLAVSALPPGTKYRFDQRTLRLQDPDAERVEVAVHLINMWICQIVINFWPEYHTARARAAHMLSGITGLIVSEHSTAQLEDPLCLSSTDNIQRVSKDRRKRYEPPTAHQRALMLKATIGWYHHQDSDAANRWGKVWLRPIVIRAHDILVEMQGFRPLVSKNNQPDILARQKDALASLVAGLGSLQISSPNVGQSKSTDNNKLPDTHDAEEEEHLCLTSSAEETKSSRLPSGKLRVVVHSKLGATQESSSGSQESSARDHSNDDALIEALSTLTLEPGESEAMIHTTSVRSLHSSTKSVSSDTGSKWRPIGQPAIPIDVTVSSYPPSESPTTLEHPPTSESALTGDGWICERACDCQSVW